MLSVIFPFRRSHLQLLYFALRELCKPAAYSLDTPPPIDNSDFVLSHLSRQKVKFGMKSSRCATSTKSDSEIIKKRLSTHISAEINTASNSSDDIQECAVCKEDRGDPRLCDFCPLVYHEECLPKDQRLDPAKRWCCPKCKFRHNCEAESIRSKLSGEKLRKSYFTCENCCNIYNKESQCYFVPSDRSSAFCVKCQTDPLESKVERIVNWRYKPGFESGTKDHLAIEYLIKYENYSFHWCEWQDTKLIYFDAKEIYEQFVEDFDPLNTEPPRYTEDFDAPKDSEEYMKFFRYGIKPQFLMIERIIFYELQIKEYLVKWCELPYSMCTYEDKNADIITDDLLTQFRYIIRKSKYRFVHSDSHLYFDLVKKFDKRAKNFSQFTDFSSFMKNMDLKIGRCESSRIDEFASLLKKHDTRVPIIVIATEQNADNLCEKLSGCELYIVKFYGSKESLEVISDFEILNPAAKTNPKFDLLLIDEESFRSFKKKFSNIRIYYIIEITDDSSLYEPVVFSSKSTEKSGTEKKREGDGKRVLKSKARRESSPKIAQKILSSAIQSQIFDYILNFGLKSFSKISDYLNLEEEQKVPAKHYYDTLNTLLLTNDHTNEQIKSLRFHSIFNKLIEDFVMLNERPTIEDKKKIIVEINDYGLTDYRDFLKDLNIEWSTDLDLLILTFINQYGANNSIEMLCNLSEGNRNDYDTYFSALIDKILDIKAANEHNFKEIIGKYYQILCTALLFDFKAKLVSRKNAGKKYTSLNEFQEDLRSLEIKTDDILHYGDGVVLPYFPVFE
ncbi:MAG: choline dehydrogenase 5 [Marteilia pararefringens]